MRPGPIRAVDRPRAKLGGAAQLGRARSLCSPTKVGTTRYTVTAAVGRVSSTVPIACARLCVESHCQGSLPPIDTVELFHCRSPLVFLAEGRAASRARNGTRRSSANPRDSSGLGSSESNQSSTMLSSGAGASVLGLKVQVSDPPEIFGFVRVRSIRKLRRTASGYRSGMNLGDRSGGELRGAGDPFQG
ncbi:MAG: hypothetical protein KatS3mg077_1543 [Candidatus Binatia bacterium]|nr:MAG: hypothetical protein KatS3mg077_1533 [Candidatus Binatia bacterium]GIW44261.1 MAG: hypothetical protein KatS3mg077_1543 [Candidatus Binatia bacterium]